MSDSFRQHNEVVKKSNLVQQENAEIYINQIRVHIYLSLIKCE